MELNTDRRRTDSRDSRMEVEQVLPLKKIRVIDDGETLHSFDFTPSDQPASGPDPIPIQNDFVYMNYI